MPYHRFKLGQTVTAHAPGIPAGPYTIIRLLPLVGREPHYQGRSEDGVVRALLESQIRLVFFAEPVNEDARPAPEARVRRRSSRT